MDHNKSVVVGLYPRRMGKSLFLGLLEDFLGVVSDTPYGDRRTRYEQYAICRERPKFFEDSIGRYAVFKLDFKSRDEAAQKLRTAVLAASGRHVDILRQLVEGEDVDVGAHDLATVKNRLRLNRPAVIRAIELYDDLKSRKGINADDLSDIGAVLSVLMKAFSRLLGRKAIVIIDECDAPFTKIIRCVNDRDLRGQLFKVYNSFLSRILKGVLAGVFDVLCSGVGSALNNAATFLAHSGFADYVTSPFQRAFGFTPQDTWGVINQYVDKLWPARKQCSDADANEFKTRVFAGLLLQCGGYRIGDVHRIFCPLTVMSFVAQLDSVKTSEKLCFSNIRFWSKTGRLSMFRPVKADSVDDLARYLRYLSNAFQRHNAVRKTNAMAARLQGAATLDDSMVVQIADQPPEQHELSDSDGDGDNDSTEAELVRICTHARVGLIRDLEIGEHLTAATVMQLLYQAGYLVPTTKGRMAIPSEEVHRDLVAFYMELSEVHGTPMAR
ncbi:hypothetical protein IWQ56_000734 [Coemansia nantahalensis]|nr:hypothetical protein IWQ56_000734 [Coemansia nantahalensis]